MATEADNESQISIAYGVASAGIPDKPVEDVTHGDARFGLMALADGVTRSRDLWKRYPTPSPARIAAECVVNSLCSTIRSDARTALPPGSILKHAFFNANRQLRSYASTFDPVDYRYNDYPGSVATAVFLREQNLYYGHIGDSSLWVRFENGRLYRLTTDQLDRHQRWVEFMKSAGYSESERLFRSRSKMRNKINQMWSYGVLTGEPASLLFVEYGRFSLLGVRQIILASDGLLDLFRLCQRDDTARQSLLDYLERADTRAILSHAQNVTRFLGKRQDDKSVILMTVGGQQ